MEHTLTTAQLRKLVEAMGGGKNFARMTDDPKVNHAIDCINDDEGDEPEYDRAMYENEVVASAELAQASS